MFGFQKLEQSLFEGQLPFAKDGPDPAEGSGIREDIYYGWVFWLQSGEAAT